MEKELLQEILSKFGLTFREVTCLSDSSHGEEDKRLNYILDDRYVLKINSPRSMWEQRLQEIFRLVDRYRAIGVYCPRLIPAGNGSLSVPWEMDGKPYICFVEEYAKYPVCGEEAELERGEIIAHLGRLAAEYSGVDLSGIHSMWSIIDLAPLDTEVDEKQENADALVKALEEAGEEGLARQVRECNASARREIQKDFRDLPRCVFQGDLNSANYLHKDGHFAGLIDFNMAGTDVNINVFANETNAFPDEARFDAMTVPEILEWMEEEQGRLMEVIRESYTMSPTEERLLPCFQQICNLFQWPNMCDLCKWLEEDTRREKACALIRALTECFPSSHSGKRS